MKIWRSESEFDGNGSAVALGMFDGVHIGHQALIYKAKDLAQELNAQCVVCTFDRHPLSVICPEKAPPQLLTIDEKLEKMEKMGVDGVLLHSFTPEFAAVEALEYLENLCGKLRIKAVVAGFNYSFGAKGRGDARLLTSEAVRLGYRAEILPPVLDESDTVSSTLIRRLMAEGDFRRAQRLLALDRG